MNYFELPSTTKVERVIPKNTFHTLAKGKVKKQLTEVVSKIIWKNKLSLETVNLSGKSVQEIHVLEISLKHKDLIKEVIEVIDKNIPYSIVFVVTTQNESYISVAAKHPSLKDANQSIIDYVFTSNWFDNEMSGFNLKLEKSLDDVLKKICIDVADDSSLTYDQTLAEVIKLMSDKSNLLKEIQLLENKLKKCKQFNQKVEINSLLLKKKAEYGMFCSL